MKKLTKVPVKREVVTEEVDQVVEEDGGFITLLGKKVFIICTSTSYAYIGTLVGVDENCVAIENAGIVYETGDWNAVGWKRLQMLPTKTVFVQLGQIESFFEVNK